MQYGPDSVAISTNSIVVGPPTRGPAPVPVTTTITVISPPVFEPVIEQPFNELANVIVDVPYAVAVENQGTAVTQKVTTLNFVGAATTNNNGNVTITISGTGASITAGTGINVVTANSITTITNTFTEVVYNGGNVSGTVTPNRSNGTIQKFTLTGNITMAPPTNMSAGQSLTLILTQDSTGSRLLNANVAYLFASGFQTLSTSSGGIDMMNIFSDGSTYYTTLTVDYS